MKTIYKNINLNSFINYQNPTHVDGINYVNDAACEVIEVKVGSENIVNEKYGEIQHPYIFLTIELTQTIDNVGLYNNIAPYSDRLIEYTSSQLNVIKGNTDSKFDEIETYSPPILNKNYSEFDDSYYGVIQNETNYVEYIINGEYDGIAYIQGTGVDYKDYSDKIRVVYDPVIKDYIEIPLTVFKIRSNGFNNNTTEYYQTIKNDLFFGIDDINPTNSAIEILKPKYSVFESHYALDEISSLEDLIKYKNNFFNL